MVGHVWLGGVGEVVNDLGEDDVGRSDVEAMGRVEEGVFFQWVAALVETGERWEVFDTGCVGHEDIARSERSESDVNMLSSERQLHGGDVASAAVQISTRRLR